MYENSVKLRPNTQFILNDLIAGRTSKFTAKKHEEHNELNSNNDPLKELAKEIKQSVEISKKVVSGETAKNIVDKINSKKIDLSAFNEESILNFNIFPFKKNENDRNNEEKNKTKSINPVSSQNKNEKLKAKDKEYFANKVKENIEKKKKKIADKTPVNKEEANKNNVTKAPEMNKFSKKIVEKKFNKIKPIHERAKDILDNKEININILKKMYGKDEDTKVNQRTSSVGKTDKYDKKKFDEWVSKQMDWYQEKSTKISKITQHNERLELEFMKYPKNRNHSIDRPTLTNQEKDKIFERLNKQNVGNIKLSKLVKHHCESVSPSPLIRSPRFKKDFANKSLNTSMDTEKTKGNKFHSCVNSPGKDADYSNRSSLTGFNVLTNLCQTKAIVKNYEDSLTSEELFSINKVNKQKFSYLRNNTMFNNASDNYSIV